jgi:hypothetical protein
MTSWTPPLTKKKTDPAAAAMMKYSHPVWATYVNVIGFDRLVPGGGLKLLLGLSQLIDGGRWLCIYMTYVRDQIDLGYKQKETWFVRFELQVAAGIFS